MNNLALETFKSITSNIKREGIDEFLFWLENETDFFKAPASATYHDAHECGLLEHSLRVNYYIRLLCVKQYSFETLAIVSLFHDICKANFYITSKRNVKNNDTGKWEQVDYYKIDEKFPYGSHGGKSVYLLLSHGIKLSDEEATAINCHMGGWDYTAYHNPSKSFEKYPLAVYLHIADMMATYI